MNVPRRILVVQGHPDPAGGHFCHALAEAYRQGAESAGHTVTVVDVARLEFPLLRTQEDFARGALPETLRAAQEALGRADHLVLIYPLWLGTMPALLKGFLEQLLRPGFATSAVSGGRRWKRLLTGESARIVITMGMPAFVYRWYFRAHSLKSLERNILGFCGIGPVRESLVGMVDAGPARRTKWLGKLQALGRKGR